MKVTKKVNLLFKDAEHLNFEAVMMWNKLIQIDSRLLTFYQRRLQTTSKQTRGMTAATLMICRSEKSSLESGQWPFPPMTSTFSRIATTCWETVMRFYMSWKRKGVCSCNRVWTCIRTGTCYNFCTRFLHVNVVGSSLFEIFTTDLTCCRRDVQCCSSCLSREVASSRKERVLRKGSCSSDVASDACHSWRCSVLCAVI